jgi:hypothetical protein
VNQLANQPMIYQLTHGNAKWRSTKMNSMKKSQPRGQCQDKILERVTFSNQEKDAELPYHLLPKRTQQAIISTLSPSMKILLPRSSWLLYQ